MYKIYKYTNSKTKKIYIGQTSRTLKARAGSNGRNYKESVSFYEDIEKYGWNSFIPVILEHGLTTQNIANEREKYWISVSDACNPSVGYNIQPGGSTLLMNDNIKKKIGSAVKTSKKFIKNNFDAHARKIISIKIDTESVERYDSLLEGARKTGTSRSNITACCNQKANSANGYIWMYLEDFIEDKSLYLYRFRKKEIERYGTKRNEKLSNSLKILYKKDSKKFNSIRKKVKRIDPVTADVILFDSLHDAAQYSGIKAPGNIAAVCNNERNKAAGYYWQWDN